MYVLIFRCTQKMPPPLTQSPTLDGLPQKFVGAMRTLFDIMDDKGAGFVKFSGNLYFIFLRYIL